MMHGSSDDDVVETNGSDFPATKKARMEVVASVSRIGDSLLLPSEEHCAPRALKAAGMANTASRRWWRKSVKIGELLVQVGDFVYLRRAGIPDEEESDAEVEDCRICGEEVDEKTLECDDCLGGFHLRCLNPRLKKIPEGDWFCPSCERLRNGEAVDRTASALRSRHRTARERLLAKELSAVRVLKLWKELDGRLWFRGQWYVIPEETAQGRQAHNGRRELFRCNRIEEMETSFILRICYIMDAEEFAKNTNGGDDCFVCEHHYDEDRLTYTRIVDMHAAEEADDWNESFESSDCSEESDEGDDVDVVELNVDEEELDEDECRVRRRSQPSGKRKSSIPSQSKAPKSKKSRVGLKPPRRSSLATAGPPVERARKQAHQDFSVEDMKPKQKPTKHYGTEFAKAKAALQLSLAPASLPCRDKERDEISRFIGDAVSAGDKCLGQSLYISGIPGTGKTAIVLDVIKAMKAKASSGALPQFHFVNINGLELQTLEHIYGSLHHYLTGEKVGNNKALELLNNRFSHPGRDVKPCVLLVDELDTLVRRNQNVLYNLFNWTSLPKSRLVVIGIANTMDLPERMLSRIASRMGQRITFAPYSYIQLEKIISTRLDDIQIFDKQALDFASRKVSASTGDARRALELCRRAVELAEKRFNKSETAADSSQGLQEGIQSRKRSVVMADVDEAIAEMFQAPNIQLMKSCAKHAKIFLLAILLEERKTNLPETTFEKVAQTCASICSSHSVECPDTDTLVSIGWLGLDNSFACTVAMYFGVSTSWPRSRLGGCRLLLSEASAKHRFQKLRLNCTREDVSLALKDDTDLPWLHKYL